MILFVDHVPDGSILIDLTPGIYPNYQPNPRMGSSVRSHQIRVIGYLVLVWVEYDDFQTDRLWPPPVPQYGLQP